MPVRQRQAGVDQQAVAVLHQPMSDEAQLRLLAFTLAVEPGIGIGGRSMGVVRTFLAMEVRFGIAPAASGCLSISRAPRRPVGASRIAASTSRPRGNSVGSL